MQSVQRVPRPAPPAGGIELSEEKLAEIIDALDATAAATESAGRRALPRLRMDVHVLLLPIDRAAGGSMARVVKVYDISQSGIAVIDGEPMRPGAKFNLLIPREGRRAIEVLCTVRHTRPLDGRHVIGAEYGTSWLEAVGSIVSAAAYR